MKKITKGKNYICSPLALLSPQTLVMRALGVKLPFRFQTCIDSNTHSGGINIAQLGSLFCVILTNALFKKFALIKDAEPIGRNFKHA